MEKSSCRQDETLPDTLTQRIGVLTRREVEARILAPLIDALGERFGRAEVLEIVRDTIVQVARQQGSELAEAMGGSGSAAFIQSLEFWQKDDALQLDILAQEAGRLDFNVTRCRYAEMYRALGVPELGALLSCSRDFALTAGFNPDARLTRTQTIMEGAPHCDFRYIFPDELSSQS
jgi:hypothetical protein